MVYDARRSDYDRQRDRDFRDQRGRDYNHNNGYDRQKKGDQSRDDDRPDSNPRSFEQRPPDRRGTWDNPRDSALTLARERHLPSDQASSPATSTSTKDDLFPGRSPVTAAKGVSQSSDIQQLIDQLSERVLWFLSHRQAVEAQKKLERHRPHNSDFGSAQEILANQKKAAEDEVNKYGGRLQEANERLKASFLPFFQNGARNTLHSSKASPSSVSVAVDQPGLAARLSSTETSLKKLISDQALRTKEDVAAASSQLKASEQQATRLQNDMLSLTETYESRLSEVMDLLRTETKKNAALEERLKRLEEKTRESSEGRSDPMVDCALSKIIDGSLNNLGELVKSHEAKIVDSVAQLNRLSETVSRLEDASGRADSASSTNRMAVDGEDALNEPVLSNSSKVSSLPVEVLQLLPAQVSQLKEELESYGNISSQLAVLKAQLANAASSSSTSDERVFQMIKDQLMETEKRTKDSVSQIAKKLGPFIDRERTQRSALQEEVEKQLCLLRDDMDTSKSDHAKFVDDQLHRSLKQADELTSCSKRIISIDNRLDEFSRENKAHMEGVHLQLQTLTGWQTNFDTRPLFRDIVSHINATLPESVTNTLKLLTKRLQDVEACVSAHEDANKRRKLANGMGATGML